MKNRIFKILIIVTFVIVLTNKTYAITDVPITYDHGYSAGGPGGGPAANTGPPAPNGDYSGTYYKNGIPHSYNCEYYYSTSTTTNIKINSYDIKGRSLMSGSTVVDTEFKAGTWIGLWNTEEKTVSWSVSKDSLKCYEVVYNFDCIYSYQYNQSNTTTYITPGSRAGNQSECTQMCRNKGCNFYTFSSKTCKCKCSQTTNSNKTATYTVYHRNEPTNGCPPTDNGHKLDRKENETTTTAELHDANILKEAYNAAKEKAKSAARNSIGNAIGTVTFLQENADGTTKEQDLQYYPQYNPAEYHEAADGWSGYYKQIYVFEPNLVCMNVLTGSIQYRNTAKCEDNEMNIPRGTGSDGNKYWQYFIPMLTKTGGNFYIRLGKKSANTRLSPAECSSLIKKYPLEDDYLHYIKSASSTSFMGIQSKDEMIVYEAGGCLNAKTGAHINSTTECIRIMNNHQMNNDYTHYIKSLDDHVTFLNKKSQEYINLKNIEKENGCEFAVTINYNIRQQFYGENSDYTALKGYGMYFRQIDVNNPFPNSINEKSYWNSNVYDKATNKVKSTGSTLTTSFDKPTYVANLTQANIDIVSRFNKYYSYTRWTSQKDHNGYKVNGMNTDGSSNFIRNNSSIYTKRASSNTYFRLGCGPANKGWGGC